MAAKYRVTFNLNHSFCKDEIVRIVGKILKKYAVDTVLSIRECVISMEGKYFCSSLK